MSKIGFPSASLRFFFSFSLFGLFSIFFFFFFLSQCLPSLHSFSRLLVSHNVFLSYLYEALRHFTSLSSSFVARQGKSYFLKLSGASLLVPHSSKRLDKQYASSFIPVLSISLYCISTCAIELLLFIEWLFFLFGVRRLKISVTSKSNDHQQVLLCSWKVRCPPRWNIYTSEFSRIGFTRLLSRWRTCWIPPQTFLIYLLDQLKISPEDWAQEGYQGLARLSSCPFTGSSATCLQLDDEAGSKEGGSGWTTTPLPFVTSPSPNWPLTPSVWIRHHR